MQNKIADKVKQLDPKKRNVTMVCIVLVILVLVLVVIQLFSGPQRSVTAYCETFRREKARLAKLPGDTWPTGVFNDELSDAGEIAASFGKLEKVAPEEIYPDITTLRSIYQSIDTDPSQAIAASLNGISVEESVDTWTRESCSN